MISGFSNWNSILFRDGDKAILCSYEGEEMVFKEGNSKDLYDEFVWINDNGKDPYKDKNIGKRMKIAVAIVFLIMMAVIFASDSFAPKAGAVIFFLSGWFPAMSLSALGVDSYKTGLFEQFRKNHGAEHTVIAYERAEKAGWTLEEVREYSYVDPQCGSVYMASLLCWSIITGIAIGIRPSWGLLISAIAAVLLFINTTSNKRNPFMKVQLPGVAKPTDRELMLAIEGMKRIKGIGVNNDGRNTTEDICRD